MQWYHADIVFDGYSFRESFYVLIDEDGLIIKTQNTKPEEDCLFYSGLLMPGMVNAHCHLELSSYKGKIEKGLGLIEFLKKVAAIRSDEKMDKKSLEDISRADREMYENGISVVGDICNNRDAYKVKKESPVYYHSFIECICIPPEKVNTRLFHYSNLYYEFRQDMSASLSLHAPYTCCDELYEEVNRLSSFVSIHNQESDEENKLFARRESALDAFYPYFKTDKRNIIRESTSSYSLQRTLDLLGGVEKLLLVHNTYTSLRDMDRVGDHVYWCFCPKANLYIENKLPELEPFLKFENRLLLGTDSLASNDSLNLLDEVMVLQNHFPNISTEVYLKWVTMNGAECFDVEGLFGSMEPGKKPGLIHIPDFDVRSRRITTSKVQRIF